MKAGIGTEVESDVEVEMEIKRKRVREAELRIEIVFSSPTLWKDSPSAQKKKKEISHVCEMSFPVVTTLVLTRRQFMMDTPPSEA